jgi:hypothetical protein
VTSFTQRQNHEDLHALNFLSRHQKSGAKLGATGDDEVDVDT